MLDTEMPAPEPVVVNAMLALVLEASTILNGPVTLIAPDEFKLMDGVTVLVPVSAIPLAFVNARVPVIFARTLPAPEIALLIVVLVAN